LQRRRRALPTADELWQGGEFIEAFARDPLVEFKYTNHIMSHAEIVAACELRRARGWGDD
jgi:hypothetical protein